MEWPRFSVPWRVYLFPALLVVFAGTAWAVVGGYTTPLDRAIGLALHADPLTPSWITETARNITSLGSVVVVLLLVSAFTGYLLVKGDTGSALLMVVSVGGALALNELLKTIFDRPRPDLELQSAIVFSSSFPSGHAALSSAAYFSMGAVLARRCPSLHMQVYVMTVSSLLVFLIGITRIYLGVHYATDVIAGWCVGSAWALACWGIANEVERRQAAKRRPGP